MTTSTPATLTNTEKLTMAIDAVDVYAVRFAGTAPGKRLAAFVVAARLGNRNAASLALTFFCDEAERNGVMARVVGLVDTMQIALQRMQIAAL